MKNYLICENEHDYLKGWDFGDFEAVKKEVIEIFAEWLKEFPLEITAGRKEKTVEMTYGFPYTSSGVCAEIGNTNCQAELVLFKGTEDERRYYFRCLRLSERFIRPLASVKDVYAMFEDRTGEMFAIGIGTL